MALPFRADCFHLKEWGDITGQILPLYFSLGVSPCACLSRHPNWEMCKLQRQHQDLWSLCMVSCGGWLSRTQVRALSSYSVVALLRGGQQYTAGFCHNQWCFLTHYYWEKLKRLSSKALQWWRPCLWKYKWNLFTFFCCFAGQHFCKEPRTSPFWWRTIFGIPNSTSPSK